MMISRRAISVFMAALAAAAIISAQTLMVYAEPDDYTEDPGQTYQDPTGDPQTEDPGYTDPQTEDPDPVYEEPSYDQPGQTEDSDQQGDDEPVYSEPEQSYTEPSDDTQTDYPTYDPEPQYPEYYVPESPYNETPNYENTWEQPYQINPETATSQISTDVSVDTSEMTKADWEQLQKSLVTDPGNTAKANLDAKDFAEIKKTKDDGNSQNDNWIFLAIGLPMTLLGAVLMAAVIIISIRNSEIGKADAAIAAHTAPKRTAPASKPQANARSTAAIKTERPAAKKAALSIEKPKPDAETKTDK